MRPEYLEVVGFGVFRDLTTVDFRDADLFALSGPTGSGKSTIIDAIVFALYGSVPRYDNKSLVAPAVSQGKLEARVRLDFTVGSQVYRVVRVVRAQARGATTKEARLERVVSQAVGDHGDERDQVEVLAGTADEVTAAVEALLGLSYEHFTTCVVLPQGDFQRFLHQKTSARQDLLVELLDLGVYEHMAQLARARATTAKHQRDWIVQQLGELSAYTPEQRDIVQGDIARLEQLLVAIDAALPALDELTRLADQARRAGADGRDRADLLRSVHEPTGLLALAGQLAAATEGVAAARLAEQAAAAAVVALDALAADAPDRSLLDAAFRDHADRATQVERVARGDIKVQEARDAEAATAATAAEARVTLDSAVAALDALRRANRAHEVAATLVPGEPCPVCLQTVSTLPAHELGDLQVAEAVAGAAREAFDDADTAHRTATSDLTRRADLLAQLHERIAEIEQHLASVAATVAPAVISDAGVIAEQLAALDELAARLQAARSADRDARHARQAAEEHVEAVRAREVAARRAFDEARDQVAALGPPPAERDDLAADWQRLLAWVATEVVSQDAAALAAEADAAKADAEHQQAATALAEQCRSAGVDLGTRAARDAVVEALADARADLDSLTSALERLADLQAESARLEETEQVGASLANHLKSTGFERWVLDEVLQRLVAGATEILRGLSGGAYSLTFDGRANFMVVDHANAEATRSARTLSGGETFLASLALALALADEVAQLAARGTVRLESIFLDEGFGTLDPDTLDTVASAIEELGARGRMVGLVTHVRELAERLPVRYEVTRRGNASVVERIDS